MHKEIFYAAAGILVLWTVAAFMSDLFAEKSERIEFQRVFNGACTQLRAYNCDLRKIENITVPYQPSGGMLANYSFARLCSQQLAGSFDSYIDEETCAKACGC